MAKVEEEKKVRKGNIQGILEMLINLHDGSLVTTSVAVIGGCGRTKRSWLAKDLSTGEEGKRKAIPEKMVTTWRSWDQLYPSMTSW